MVENEEKVKEESETNLPEGFVEGIDDKIEDDKTINDDYKFGGEPEGSEEEGNDEPENENSPEEPEEVEGEEEVNEDEGSDDDNSISDSLLQRAVRAGIDIDDARNMPDEDTLMRLTETMENSKEPADEGENPEEQSDEGSSEEEASIKFPELDPEEWDEDTIDIFDSIKGVIDAQNEKIESLANQLHESAKSEEKGFIKSKISELDKGYDFLEEEDDAVGRIQRYMDLISSEDDSLSDDKVFDRALKAAYPDETSEIKAKKRAKKAKDRSRKAMNQPRRADGKFKSSDNLTAEEEAINAITEMAKNR